jgi:hypothetical protein
LTWEGKNKTYNILLLAFIHPNSVQQEWGYGMRDGRYLAQKDKEDNYPKFTSLTKARKNPEKYIDDPEVDVTPRNTLGEKPISNLKKK